MYYALMKPHEISAVLRLRDVHPKHVMAAEQVGPTSSRTTLGAWGKVATWLTMISDVWSCASMRPMVIAWVMVRSN